MKTRQHILPLISITTLFLLVLCACSSTTNNNIMPRPTQTVTSSATSTPTPHTTPGDSYAYVRNNQVWLSLHGAPAQQITRFDYSKLDTPLHIAFDQPLWFDHSRYLVFKMRATNQGISNNCGSYNISGLSGALYVYDTTTNNMQAITLQGDPQPTPDAYGGTWSYLFKQDDTHLLAWHATTINGQIMGGLYQFDLTQILQTNPQPPKLLVDAQRLAIPTPLTNDTPTSGPTATPTVQLQVVSFRYANNTLYMQTTQTIADHQANLTIYSIAINKPDATLRKITDVGTIQVCSPVGGDNIGAFTNPGWDVSPNGQYLIVQKITADNESTHSSQIFLMKLHNDQATPITSSPNWTSSLLSQSAILSWSPDSQYIVMESTSMTNGQYLLLSTNVNNVNAIDNYNLNSLGAITWNVNGHQFALYSKQPYDDSATNNIVSYDIGKPTGRMLLPVAYCFAWSD